MANTKCYSYQIIFEVGSAEHYEDASALHQAIMRAKMILGHRICLEAYEDASDPRETKCAQLRLEFLRQELLKASVHEDRLELQSQGEKDRVKLGGRFSRRGEINLFPRVQKQHGDGPIYLSRTELAALQTAREALLFPPRHFTLLKQKIDMLDRYTSNDWLRIVGYESLDEWVDSGAKHPLYDRIDIVAPRQEGK